MLRSFLYSLNYCIKEVIKGKIFWRLNEKVLAYEAGRPETGESPAIFFRNTDPIVFVLFIYLFFTYFIKEGIKGNMFGY